LLQEQGYQVHGFFMMLPLAHLDAQLQRVQEVADILAVPLTCVDVRHQFSDQARPQTPVCTVTVSSSLGCSLWP
jgi:tRNA U34 2-thiouridine synthase MnmA/TrmU